MMSKKQLACMLTLHIIYLFLGASIFYHVEGPKEMSERAEKKLERLEIQNMLYENYLPGDLEKQDAILTKLSDYCGKTMFNYTSGDEEGPIKWDFYHSFFFSYTVASTVGYGNIAPTTHAGRLLMIPYALFGMPINAILLANMGEYFGLKLIKIYRKYKRRSERRADVLDFFFQHLGMLGQICLYLVPGFLFFIFLPACLFMVFEGWDYVGSVYYAFVTLTTIGFGDIVAGTVNNGFANGYFVAYQIFLIAWITFGLGYVVMLLGFITSGLRSEGVHRLEQKLANQFKSTQNRILQGFTRDVAVIRKIINEANLIKLKPIYVEEAPRLCRSASCPELTFDIEPRCPVFKRKRANSENIHLSRDMLRIQSDTDLLGIDKDKTFSASEIVKPAELLARVVNVLGNYEDQQREREQGVHMFEDRDILASEKPPLWSIGNESINSPYNQRHRALSVAVPNYRKESIANINNDHTWTNGVRPDQYIDSINNQRSPKLSLPTGELPIYPVRDNDQPRGSLLSRLFRKSSSTENPLPPSPDSPINIAQNRPRRGSFFPTFNTSQEKSDAEIYKEKTKRGRHSIFPTFDFSESDEDSIAKSYKEKTKRGRHSIFPTFDFNIDEDEDKTAKAYKEKTKRGRTSIFPNFDFSENDEDAMAKAYKEKTRKGRHSIFPTFDFNVDDDEEEEKAKAYRDKTKRGRHSIFPTFDFSEDDEDKASKYKESTKKGRRSIFPTFNFGDDKNDDESINEDEVKSYQNRTKKGRGSLFPTFGRSKKNDSEDDIIPDDSEEVKSYQNKTKRGRTSLFPSFGKERKSSASSNDDPSGLAASIKKYQSMTKKGRGSLFSGDNDDSELERYRNRTRRGRPSLFDPDVDITELPQEEQVEALEQTSVADLLRVLALLDTVSPSTSGNRAESSPLADIISGLPNVNQSTNRRRGSIRPDFAMPAIPVRAEPEETSVTGPRRRRVSARAAAPQFMPTLQTVVAGAELQTTALSARENRMSMLSSPPPPYSESEAEVEQEEPSQGRMRRFSPSPSGSGSKTGPVPRLFSKMRKDNIASVEEEGSRRGSLTDVVVDNNKDVT